MKQNTDFKEKIVQSVWSAQASPTGKIALYSDESVNPEDFRNELVFFIKPEVTKASPGSNLPGVLDTVFEKLDQFGVRIVNAQLLGAQYLKDNGVMASHYGVINKVATDPKQYMSQAAKDNFKAQFGFDVDAAPVVGAIQALDQDKSLTPGSLEDIWKQGKTTKLAGGTYCAPVSMGGGTVYLMNGFHPQQLQHFVANGRSIVAFHVVSNTDWTTLRNNLIGATDPAKAAPGSLRNEFLLAKSYFGLDEVSQGSNGVHLSAGPIEGTVEVSRFFDGPNQLQRALETRPVGRALKNQFGEARALHVLSDGKIEVAGKVMGAFDATEEKNVDDAIGIIAQSKFILG